MPAVTGSSDGNGYEIGVKFIPDYSGYVTKIKFYKDAQNTGTHVGRIWTASGTLLASVTFASETGSGWQTAVFSSPAFVSSGQTYIASYSAPNGHYAITTSYFANAGSASPPLYAPSGPQSNGNAVAGLSPGQFPSYTNPSNNNLWVDIVFQ